MSELHPRTYFFKPSHPIGREPVLNLIRVAENLSKGTTTTLVLDTNVLIHIERVVKGGNKKSLLKQHGLHNLVDFINRCPPQSIALSPGMALEEMPPALAEKSRWRYEAFCSEHLPRFVDIPNCIKPKFEGKETDYGFLDLEPIAQAFFAIPFCSLLYLNIIDKTYQGSPIRKFEEFLRRLSNDLDILSAQEIEIAKYCFAEPPAKSREAIRAKTIFRKNFLKTKNDKAVRTFDEAMAVAFNGACDLSLINVSNVTDTTGIDGVPQDCWIATRDKKLYEFSALSHYINIDGEAGKYATSSVLADHEHDDYWQQASSAHHFLGKSRTTYHQARDIDVMSFIGKAHNAIEETRRAFENA